uniref:Uncharacterized protein n=1 Tax=Sphaerodactylus townsendi TaxID=933632 RepID=A0ACB8FYT9_9SAUR
MFWVSMVSLLAMWGTGSYSQPVQPPSASVLLGNTVKLSCTGVSGYGVYWYQQKSGNPPRYLLYYYSDSSKHQGSGVPSRFSGSKDSSGNTGYLTITGVQAEDEADYYCAREHDLSSMFWMSMVSLLAMWGTGSYSQPVQPPSASVLPGNTVKLSCTGVSGYGVYWYQQNSGNPPRYLLYYYSDSSKHQGSGVPLGSLGPKTHLETLAI